MKNIWNAILQFLKQLFTPALTREMIADKIIEKIQADVDAKLRETGGKNRGPRIDSFNKRTGVEMGSPYCASGAWCAIDDACKDLGLKNPMMPTASSQAFRKEKYVPGKYMNHVAGEKGDVAVFQVPDDPSHGHVATLRLTQPSPSTHFSTVEYNTDGSGTRDGDGAYYMARNTIDKSSLNAGKLFICFTDVPQWILDFNKQGVTK